MTMNHRVAALVSLYVLASCGSDADPKLVRIRDRINPILDELRTPAQGILGMMGGDVREARIVIAACMGSDALLQQLGVGDFRYDEPGGPAAMGVSRAASHLVDDRHLYCGKQSDLAIRDCARWCVVSWTRLVTEVERLRVNAARRGVDIASIAP